MDISSYQGKSGRIGGSKEVSADSNVKIIGVCQTGGWYILQKLSGAWIEYERNLMVRLLKFARVLSGYRNSELRKYTLSLTKPSNAEVSESQSESFVVDVSYCYSTKRFSEETDDSSCSQIDHGS